MNDTMTESMIQNSVGKSLREVRNRYGMNQENLALKLGIKRQTISSYERGVTFPDIFTLIRIADVFNISLDELVGREYPPKPKEVPGRMPARRSVKDRWNRK